jgi:hypothetical protein
MSTDSASSPEPDELGDLLAATEIGFEPSGLGESVGPREPYKSHVATYATPAGYIVVATEWWSASEAESVGGVLDFDIWDDEGTDNGFMITQRISVCDAAHLPISVAGPLTN